MQKTLFFPFRMDIQKRDQKKEKERQHWKRKTVNFCLRTLSRTRWIFGWNLLTNILFAVLKEKRAMRVEWAEDGSIFQIQQKNRWNFQPNRISFRFVSETKIFILLLVALFVIYDSGYLKRHASWSCTQCVPSVQTKKKHITGQQNYMASSRIEILLGFLFVCEAIRFRVSEKGTRFLGYQVPFNSIFIYRVPGSKVPEKWPSSRNGYPVTRIFSS